jgi:hypothetical protein
VDLVGVREGKNPKERALGIVLGIFGKRFLRKDLSVRAPMAELR